MALDISPVLTSSLKMSLKNLDIEESRASLSLQINRLKSSLVKYQELITCSINQSAMQKNHSQFEQDELDDTTEALKNDFASVQRLLKAKSIQRDQLSNKIGDLCEHIEQYIRNTAYLSFNLDSGELMTQIKECSDRLVAEMEMSRASFEHVDQAIRESRNAPKSIKAKRIAQNKRKHIS